MRPSGLVRSYVSVYARINKQFVDCQSLGVSEGYLFPFFSSEPATATSELLVEDLSTATLEVSLRDENRLGKDSVLGQASIPPPEIPAMHSSWTGWLPLKQAEDKLGKGKVELRVETLPAVGAGEGIELRESSANLGTSIPSTNDNGLDSDEEDAEVRKWER